MRSKLSLSILLFAVQVILAEIPQTISYQGFLTDASGDPVPDSSYTLEFNIYDDPTLGNHLWYELHTDIPVTGGVFNVVLGSSTPLSIPFDVPYWLEIVFDGSLLTPRVELTASAYSLNSVMSEDASMLGGQNPEYYLDWTHLSNIPTDIADGDQLGIQSIDGVSNEGNNIDFLGDGITITPDDGANTITFSSASPVITVDASNYASISIEDNSLVNVLENISISSDYNGLNHYNLFIHGGGFIGTGVEEVDFGNESVISGMYFENLNLDGNYIEFIKCSFAGNIRFPHNANLTDCRLNNVTTTTTHSIGTVSTSNINNSILTRIVGISDCDVENSTIGGTALNSERVSSCLSSCFYGSKIYLRSGSVFSNNRCSDTNLEIPDLGRGHIIIANNYFDNLLSGENEIISIDNSSSGWRIFVITGNTFIIQSDNPQSIYITGSSSSSYSMNKISANCFLKGQQAIYFAGTMKTVVTDNVVRQTDLGVSNGGYLYVFSNYDID